MRTALLLPASLGLSVIAAFSGGCSGDDGHNVDDPVDCTVETRDEDFYVGLTKDGRDGLLSFKLTEIEPPVRFENRWVLQLNQVAGAAPITGATLTITPYMPDHGHVAPFNAEVTPLATAGQYELDPVYISMPGYWEVTIEAESAGGSDSAVFKICIPS